MSSADQDGDRKRRPRSTKEPDSVSRQVDLEFPSPPPPTLIPDNSVGERHIDFNSINAKHLQAITLEVGKYIQSNGFQTGVSGWHINAEGDAEFNDVNVRGELEATLPTGEKVRISSTSVVATNLPSLEMYSGHNLEDLPGGLWTDYSGADPTSVTSYPVTVLASPQFAGAGSEAAVWLEGRTANGVIISEISLVADAVWIPYTLTVNGSSGTNNGLTVKGTASVHNSLRGEWGGGGGGVRDRGADHVISFDYDGVQLHFYQGNTLITSIP